MAAAEETEDAEARQKLFQQYQLTEEQRHMFDVAKALRNMPASFRDLDDEEILWAVAVETIGMREDPSPSDKRYHERKIEERLRRIDDAEKKYGWFSLRWTKPIMKRLIQQWFCGMLVIDPDLRTKEGHPLQFVHEFYGEGSGYPSKEDQTDEWKKECMDLYALMARSICRAYPMSTTKGIVSISDMADFDWEKYHGVYQKKKYDLRSRASTVQKSYWYDMGTKERNANIGSMIPNKLHRMITFNPDEKMKEFYNNMTAAARKKFGLAQYSDLQSAVAGESEFLPDELPTFLGGDRRVDILECMKYLFRREPDALNLLIETHSEMESAGELPKPKYME